MVFGCRGTVTTYGNNESVKGLLDRDDDIFGTLYIRQPCIDRGKAPDRCLCNVTRKRMNDTKDRFCCHYAVPAELFVAR